MRKTDRHIWQISPFIHALLLLLSLASGGCGPFFIDEMRHHTIEEAALLPVPIAPHAIGALPKPNETTIEGRYNYSATQLLPNRVENGTQANLYLQHVAGGRVAHTFRRTEVSGFADYAFRGWAEPIAPAHDLPLPSNQVVWGGVGVRSLVAGSPEFGLVCGGEFSFGSVPSSRRVTTVTEHFKQTFADPDPNAGLRFRPQQPTGSVLTSTDTTRSESQDIAMEVALGTQIGVVAQLDDNLGMDFTVFGQLVPNYPAVRHAEQTCSFGFCQGTAPEDVRTSEMTLAWGAALGVTYVLANGMTALMQAHVHTLRLDAGVWHALPGATFALRIPLDFSGQTPSNSAAAAAPTHARPAARAAERTEQQRYFEPRVP